MTASIVNLRRVRKAAARADREAAATTARALHGRSKGQRAAELLDAQRAARRLDGARREDRSTVDDG